MTDVERDRFGELGGDRTAALAERLGVPWDYFVDVLGGGWRDAGPSELHDVDTGPGDPAGPMPPWHVSGRPEQLMIRVLDGHCFLARPEGRWAGGTHDLRWEGRDVVHLGHEAVRDPEAVRPLVASLLRARRRRLRWCPVCREQVGPERMAGGTCHRCFQATVGGVF